LAQKRVLKFVLDVLKFVLNLRRGAMPKYKGKKSKKDQYISRRQKGQSPEEARSRSYLTRTAAWAAEKAYQETRTAPDRATGTDHPAVKALTPRLRVQWDSLAPAIREWYLATTTLNPLIDTDDKTDDLSLCDIPGDMEMLLSTRCTGDLAPGGKWDRIAKGGRNV
jgi:hypothetical protein